MGDDAVDDDRESLEKKKLRLEIDELDRPWWWPANVLSIAATLASLVVVVLALGSRDVEVQRLKNEEWDARRALDEVTAALSAKEEALAAKQVELEQKQADLGDVETDRNNVVAEFQRLKTDVNSISADIASATTPEAKARAAQRAADDVNSRASKVLADRDTMQRSYVSAKSDLQKKLSAGLTGKPLAEALDKFRKARLYASVADQAEDATLIKRASDVLNPKAAAVVRPTATPSKAIRPRGE